MGERRKRGHEQALPEPSRTKDFICSGFGFLKKWKGGADMAKELNVNRVFEAIANIVSQREGVTVTVVEVKKLSRTEEKKEQSAG